MTDACPNGSEPAPGAPTQFYLGPALIQSLFPDWADWLGQLIPLIGNQLVSTADLCATSPNDSSGITAEDVALALITPGGMIGLAAKVQAAAEVQVWNTYCVCLPSAVESWVVVAEGDECTAAGDQTGPFPVATGAHEYQYWAQCTVDNATGAAWVGVAGYNGASLVFDTGGHRIPFADGLIQFASNTANVDRFYLTHAGDDAGHLACSHMEVRKKIPSGTVVVPTPPAPQDQPPGLPDAPPPPSCADLDAVCAAISQLSQQLSLVNIGVSTVETGVNDLQTVSPAKTLLEAGSSSGNSGDSTHAVADIRAVQVHVTTIPAYKGKAWSDPYTWSDLGVVRLESDGFWSDDFPIVREFFTLVDVSPLVTTIGLSLAPGVVATVTWLTKGT